MRIIGGTVGGLILRAPKGFEVRPTPDLVRQALFNSLGERVLEARVLELFGGTGALSLECLSRGAAQATCIEISPRHARFIQENFASHPPASRHVPAPHPGRLCGHAPTGCRRQPLRPDPG